MEEVESSNLSRSTTTFQRLTVPRLAKRVVPGVQLESKPPLSLGSLGHRADLDAAHDWAFILNAIRGMGGVGIVFHACCLLETTTIAFPIRMLPVAPHTLRVGVPTIPNILRNAEEDTLVRRGAGEWGRRESIRTAGQNSDASDRSDAVTHFEGFTRQGATSQRKAAMSRITCWAGSHPHNSQNAQNYGVGQKLWHTAVANEPLLCFPTPSPRKKR